VGAYHFWSTGTHQCMDGVHDCSNSQALFGNRGAVAVRCVWRLISVSQRKHFTCDWFFRSILVREGLVYDKIVPP
jgi:hypothetical protein